MVALMNMNSRVIGCLLCACTLIALLTGCTKIESATEAGVTGPSSTTPSISLSSSASQVNNGASFTVAVNVDSAADLFGSNIELQYNKSIVDVTAVQDGGFLTAPVAGPFYSTDSLTEYLIIGITSTANSSGVVTGVSGSGTLCNITFQAKAPGTTSISFISSQVKFYDTSGNPTSPDVGFPVSITVN